MSTNVFISYSHKNREICHTIAALIEGIPGVDIWYDKGLIPGEVYSKTIAEKLKAADALVAFISNDSVKSDWVKDELSYAKDNGKRIVPVWIEHTDLPVEIDLMLHRFHSLFWYLRGSDAEFKKEMQGALGDGARPETAEEEDLFEGFGNEFSESENEKIRVCLEKERQEQFSYCYSAENALLLGKVYLYGGAVPVDRGKARYYLKISEYFGNMDAACLLAQMGLDDIGIVEDQSIYQPFLDKIYGLADEGSMNAKLFLGNAYWYGKYGLEVSYEKSAQYYEECARKGNARAQYIMAANYYEGDGVVRDYDLAVMYANLAVEQKYIKAWRRWGKFYRDGKAVPQDYVKSKEAYERGIQWGDFNGNNKIGDMYYYGWGVEVNYETAISYYQKALKAPKVGQRYALRKAYNALGRCYELGTGVPKDMKQAAKQYMLAYKFGDMDARDKYLACAEAGKNEN